MSNSVQFKKLPKNVQNELTDHNLRLRPFVSAQRMWERLLTTADRTKLGADLKACYAKYQGTVGMWMYVRNFSHLRAVIELAHQLNFMSATDYQWLLREIGESRTRIRNATVPSWNAESGELVWGNRTVRRVRIFRVPSNVQLILDAFQQAGWPTRIDNPLPHGPDAQKLHQALFSLNKGLKRLAFCSQEGGTAISWSTT